MRILALDIATRTGWAHSLGASGVWDLKVKSDESGGMKLIRFESKLNEIAKVGINLVAFEAVRNVGPRQGRAVVCQAELQGVLKRWCEEMGIDYRGYSPSEIKKHATGKGNANKERMLEAARERWPDVDLIDDNHADAKWLLDLAMKEYGEA